MSIKRILLVDDDVDFIDSQAELLEYSGFDPVVAYSGDEALNLAKQAEPDLVLMDMKMSGMNGIECMTELRRTFPKVRVVMVSAFTHQEFTQQAFDAGALAVLNKPLVPDQLIQIISILEKNSTILLVEDDEELSEEIEKTLSDHHYSTICVATVSQAKEQLANHCCDFMLLDFNLSEGNSKSLIDWIVDNGIKIKTTLMTDSPLATMDAIPFFSLDRLITKPFDPRMLISFIDKLDQENKTI